MGATSLVDVGGGTSTVVDEALRLGLRRIAVVDVSERALEVARDRLGRAAERVEWIVADLTELGGLGQFGVWHDRAVLHFLTNPTSQDRYVTLCERTVVTGGTAIVATFAPDGPDACSGLRVHRYDESGLSERCGPRFALMDSERHTHMTPRGVEQRFLYASFRRTADDLVSASISG